MLDIHRPGKGQVGVVLVFLLVIAVLARSTVAGPAASIVLLLAGGLAVVGLLSARSPAPVRTVLLAAFAVRVAVVALDEAFGVFPKQDAAGYHRLAVDTLAAWQDGTVLPGLTPGVFTYASVTAALYGAFGADPVLPRLLSAILGTIATALVILITRHFHGDRASIAAGTLYALFPSLVQLESEALRDPIVHVVILVLFYALAASTSSWPARVALAAAAIPVLQSLRGPTLWLLIAVAALSLAWMGIGDRRPMLKGPSGHRGGPRPVRTFMMAALPAAALATTIALLAPSTWGYLTDPDELNRYRSAWAQGGSAYLVGVRLDGPLEVLLFAPVGALYFLFTPFPWQIHNGLALAAMVENLLLLYPIAFMSFRWLDKGLADAGARPLVLFLLIGALLYGLIEGNIGTAMRHRAQFIWVFFVFASPRIVASIDSVRLRLSLRATPIDGPARAATAP